MAKSSLIYLDHAATSYPKPPPVEAAMRACLKEKGGNPGRGSHRLALGAAEEIYRCRDAAASLFGCVPEHVIFTLNTTHALNLAIKGLLSRGGHALCSDMEHNAVRRPLHRLYEDGLIDYDIFHTYPTMTRGRDEAILASLAAHLRPDTCVVVCTHSSNICSACLPVAKIGAFCRRHGLYFVLDAAQSAGIYDIDMTALSVDALCVPGHKGLLGPQGTGMLILGNRLAGEADRLLAPLMEGGNGVDSLSPTMSSDLPERYEPGTLATPAIAGLRAGIDYVRAVTPAAIREREAWLGGLLREGLSTLPGVTLYAPEHEGGVVLFSVAGMDSEAVGQALDREDICVRPGFHCAALAHATLGTPAGGAVRASVGYTNSERDIRRTLEAVRRLCR